MQSLTEMAVLFPSLAPSPATPPASLIQDSGSLWAGILDVWVSVFAAEATAANILIGYWTRDIHVAVWLSLFIVINLAIYCFPVRIFREVEFVVSTLKVVSYRACGGCRACGGSKCSKIT